jgi:chemotaxis protein MotA
MRLVALFKDYAHKARRNGILSLEPEVEGIEDPFLRKGMQLTVDGLEPHVIQDILETEIASTEDRHERGAEILAAAGAYAPALGMIGTLIGLIQMLQTMNDPSTIGPSMSLALVATFYGAVLANLLFIPMSGKLKRRSREEILLKEMILEGALAISKGENPRIIEEKLTAFIPVRNR